MDYRWPAVASVRDFSNVVPLGSATADDEVIARTDGLPVALRRTIGPGMLLFLGSPLGPTLRSGDREATQLLAAITADGRRPSPQSLTANG